MHLPPPLVLIPGTLCDERLWVDVLPQLTTLTECQTVNWCAKELSASDAASRILNQAPATFALAGMSMGGSIALEICAQAPHRVEGLALVSCQARGDSRVGAETRSKLVEYATQFGLGTLVRDKLWPLYVHQSRLNDQSLLEAVIAMAERAGMQSYKSQGQLLASRSDHLKTLASLTVPVAIVAGDSDLLCTPIHQAEMMSVSRNGKRTEIQNCGHMSPLEHPQSVLSALSTWLDEIVQVATEN
uniref:Thioesterase domain-containing protein n=1 Tax=Curvibacter symbiont subsp. Hydra magnipapillata TaxID=667019 RepID=C9YBM8_CURXX|nr:hypothetical protein Csp_A15290 [Curvibacter putative symbiont of Hydra magnipapillata]